MATVPLPIFHPCLELVLQVNHHDLIPCFSCELAAIGMSAFPKGRIWGYHEAEYALDSGKCTQTCYHQEHRVPGAPPMPLTISMYLFSGVEIQRNWLSKETSNDFCFGLPHVIPMALWQHYSLPKNSFLFGFLKFGLWITSAPDSEAWWLELNSQSAGTQRCPAFSLVSVLFLQPDS